MPEFAVGDEVVVVRVRPSLFARVGDKATVVRSNVYGDCIVVRWHEGVSPEAARTVYADQFEHVGGPW